MSVASHAYRRLCELYRLVLKHMGDLTRRRMLGGIKAIPLPVLGRMEPLEPRLCLSGAAISGTVWDDANANRVMDAGEHSGEEVSGAGNGGHGGCCG